MLQSKKNAALSHSALKPPQKNPASSTYKFSVDIYE